MLFSLKNLAVCVFRLNPTTLRFKSLHTTPNRSTIFSSYCYQQLDFLIQTCTSLRDLKLIQARIIIHGLFTENQIVGKLIAYSALSEHRDIRYAHYMFDQISQPNRFMYNTLIRGYSDVDESFRGLLIYQQMLCSGITPNEFTLPFVLKSCASNLAYFEGLIVHGQIVKLGFGDLDCVINALMNVYIAFGSIGCARKVFDDMCFRTLVSWNSMIGGYSKMGYYRELFLLFKKMREFGLLPDEFTFTSLLSVSAQTCDLDLGRFAHLCMVVNGVTSDLHVKNALVDMYGKCGQLDTARYIFDQMHNKNVITWTSMLNAYAKHGLIDFSQQCFDQMPTKNVVSWNCMMSCFVQEGRCREAYNLFCRMCNSGVSPDENTLISILSASSQLGDLVMGKEIHGYILANNITPSVTLFNSLVDMYAKCGPVERALEIFYEMPKRNLVSWNVLIGALALHGRGSEAMKLFEGMLESGIKPDEITFTGLLSACSHSGLVDAGQYYFDKMSQYGVSREIDHYACMVDLLGRGGHFEEAVNLIVGMPMRPDVVVWGALLGACRTHGNAEIGMHVLKHLLELEPYTGGLYVLMANIFCEAGRWDDVKKIRKLMNDHTIEKCRAISSIEIDGCVCQFMVDDRRHESWGSIQIMLDLLNDHLKFAGNRRNLSSTFSEEKEI